MTTKPTKYYSTIQENTIADFLGWKVVAGSGARDLSPGDICGDTFLGECKTHTTSCDKIVFFADVWDKIREEAAARFRYPVLFVDDGSQTVDSTWVLTLDCAVNAAMCAKYQLPVDFNVNLSFMSPYLETVIKYLKECQAKTVVFTCEFSGVTVAVLKLSDFKEVMN